MEQRNLDDNISVYILLLNALSTLLRPTIQRRRCLWKHCVCVCIESCLTLCDLMDCSPPGSSANGIFQARLLEWVAISYSRGLNLCPLGLLHLQADCYYCSLIMHLDTQELQWQCSGLVFSCLLIQCAFCGQLKAFWKGFTFLDAMKNTADLQEEVKIWTLTEVWEKFIPTLMDHIEGFKTSLEEELQI